MSKKVIIFDFDGTLVDTMHIFADVASRLISENYGIEREAARKLYFETSGLPFCRQIEIMFPGHDLNAKVASAYEIDKLEATTDIRMEQETREALSVLKNSGYDLAVSSNNYERNIADFISNNGLSGIFALSLGFRQEGFGKGKPHFDLIMDKLGVDKREMIFVGDALNDARLAKENDIDFIGKIGTFAKKEFAEFDKNIFCINKISDLILWP